MPARRNAIVTAVVLAILLAAAAITVPAWRTHLVRTRVADALKAADGAKLVVMEAALTAGGLGKLGQGNLEYDTSKATGPYVAGLALDPYGRITVSTRNTGAKPDPVLQLVPAEAQNAQGAGLVAWSCMVVSGDAAAVPDDCHAAPIPGRPR